MESEKNSAESDSKPPGEGPGEPGGEDPVARAILGLIETLAPGRSISPVAAARAFARALARPVDPPDAARRYPPGDPEVLEQGDTIYLTVADGAGNMVSLIQSNYRGMRQGMPPRRRGLVLPDRADLFRLQAGPLPRHARPPPAPRPARVVALPSAVRSPPPLRQSRWHLRGRCDLPARPR